MSVEIERRFLVEDDRWRVHVLRSTRLRQGYLSNTPGRLVRVRLIDDVQGFLTVKGAQVGDCRPEFEYAIPVEDAHSMLRDLCTKPLVDKTRHELDLSPGVWTVDEFAGSNAGLVLAEVELTEDHHFGAPPAWAGVEVTHDDRFTYSYLRDHWYRSWM